MEPTQLGLIVAGSVVALTIAAVALKNKTPYENLDDPYTIRNSKGTNVYDSEEGMWQFFPDKKGGKRKTRRKR